MEDFSILKGKVLQDVIVDGDIKVLFKTVDGKTYKLEHHEECCEDVYIESIVGDINDLIGSEIVLAEVSTNQGSIDNSVSYGMWTFYRIATTKGHVDMRWFGCSNGYYSEDVDFTECSDEHENR